MIFDYKCVQCEHVSEHFIRAGHPEPVCTECGSHKLVRLMCAPGMVKTNYANKTGFKSR